MQVYKKILLLVDGSSADKRILEHVALLAKQNKAQVTILHVVHSHTIDQERVLHKKAEALLGTYGQKLAEENIDVKIKILSGEPEEEILEEIKKNNYDLVAMGTHGHKLLGDLLYGSVSETLKHKISTPLLLIKAEQ
ncbi:universal stress protein [candidate division KSB1 bacterium]|jgi:universal stress protein A|nr:MAG: universal stress protein [candidate division KSB1 bacterium]